MYQPKFEFLSFASLPVQRKQIVLRAMLECLIVADWNYILEHPNLPSLYDFAPKYILKVRPAGIDAWQDIPQTIALGSGDCVAEGSLVKTERGFLPIEKMKIGDRVATRAGWKRVENHGCMALNAETLRLRSDTGSVFRATKDHRVLTNNRGFIPLGQVRERDELVEVSSEGALIKTRVAAIESAPRTNVYDITVADKHEFASYESNGDVSNGIYSSNCKDFACVGKGTLVVVEGKGEIPIAQVIVGDRVATRRGWRLVKGSRLTRTNAETRKLLLSNGRELVATPDHRVLTLNRDWTPLGELRVSDVMLAPDGGDGTKSHEMVTVKSIEESPNQDVYDLAVEDAHEFFANGVLVHNCWRIAELRQQGYDDVYPHIKVSYHQDPSGREPMMTVYHIQVRIHDIIEDPSALLGMPKQVSYEELRGAPANDTQQQQMAAGGFASSGMFDQMGMPPFIHTPFNPAGMNGMPVGLVDAYGYPLGYGPQAQGMGY